MQRRTRQREAILACFTAEDRPLTPVEAHELVSAKYPSLGIATVYRAVNAFVAAGMLTAIVVGGVMRYEAAGKEHHHHFLCQSCNKTFCLEECPVAEEHLAPRGFSVLSHELVVSGTCPSCNHTEARSHS